MKRSQNPYIFMFRRMRHYAPSKKLLLWMLIFTITSKLLRLAQPRILGQIVNEIQLNGFSGRTQIKLYLI